MDALSELFHHLGVRDRLSLFSALSLRSSLSPAKADVSRTEAVAGLWLKALSGTMRKQSRTKSFPTFVPTFINRDKIDNNCFEKKRTLILLLLLFF